MTREGLGHTKYWPIYEEACAHGLPVVVHVGGFSGSLSATGMPTFHLEAHAGFAAHQGVDPDPAWGESDPLERVGQRNRHGSVLPAAEPA